MLAEYGDDGGVASSAAHRKRLFDDFAQLRAMIDDFAPDFIVMFGDDQYENFREDIIPPFCVFGLDSEWSSTPWRPHGPGSEKENWWGEPADWELLLHGHRDAAKLVATGLMERGIPIPYAYRTLHQDVLSHAFTNTILFLDAPRRGFPHPVVPFHVNCYGSEVLRSRGGAAHLFETEETTALPDPPGPSPAMCMDVGAALAATVAESPYRAVFLATSSWSHAFLSANTGYLVPDLDTDRVLLEDFRAGDYRRWRGLAHKDLQRSGHHELLNWMVLAGAMEALGRKPVIVDFVETYLFQATKCFAIFPV